MMLRPLRGWRLGWIGGRGYAAWMLVLGALGIALGWAVRETGLSCGTPPCTVPTIAAVLWTGLAALALNLTAQRTRDAGMPGWPVTLAIAVFLVAYEYQRGAGLLPALWFAGMLAATPSDALGRRVVRDGMEDVFD